MHQGPRDCRAEGRSHFESPSMRDAIQSLPGSRIREVANAGLGRDYVLAFWFD